MSTPISTPGTQWVLWMGQEFAVKCESKTETRESSDETEQPQDAVTINSSKKPQITPD